MKKIEELVRPCIRSLKPYSTARDEYKGNLGVFLDANESPYPSGWNRYPDPRQTAVKEKLSGIKGLPRENIFLGNGSDEAIDLIFRVFCNPGKDNAIIIDPSYGMYSVCAGINDIQTRFVNLGEEFTLPSEEIRSKIDGNTKLLFLCSPNNPSGNAFDTDELLALVSDFPGIVVIDEAYADFSSKGSLRAKVLEYENLIILQTLSKAWGLAALRLGIAYSSTYIISLMNMVKYPYNVNKASQEAALKALDTPIDGNVRTIISQREMMSGKLAGYSFVHRVYPSDANFILVKVDDADRLYGHLIHDGIIVRNRTHITGCANCLRITVGLPEENELTLKSLDAYEKGGIH